MKFLLPLILAGAVLVTGIPHDPPASDIIARACPGNVFANKETCNRKCPGKKQCIRVQFPSGPTVGWVCPCGAGAAKRSDDPVDAVSEKVERDESLEPRACPNKFFHDEAKCNKKCPGKKRCGETEVRGPEGPIRGWKCACAL